MADPKWEDTEPVSFEETSPIEDTPSWDETEAFEEEAVSAEDIEDVVTGFGRGASFGLTPIFSGIASAGMEAAEDVGDVLGLTTDAELKEQGIEVQDDYKGFGGLLDAYYAGRERQQEQEKKSEERSPYLTMGADIAGGVATGSGLLKLGAGLASGGRAAKAASTVLPSAQRLGKAATTGQKVRLAATEGAKLGAVRSLGEGESKLLEGELGETGKELAEGAGIGALTGGALQGAMSTGKGLLSTVGRAGKFVKDKVRNIDIVDDFIDAFRYAKAGRSVVGDKANKKIIKQSEILADDYLIPFLKDRKESSSKAVGKILDRASNEFDNPEEFRKSLAVVRKSLDYMDDVSTQPEKINQLKKAMDAAIAPKKGIKAVKVEKNPLDTALSNLKNKVDQAKAKAREAGQEIEFSDPTYDPNSQSYVTRTIIKDKPSKVIAQPIKGDANKAMESIQQKIRLEQAKAVKRGDSIQFTDPTIDPLNRAIVTQEIVKGKPGPVLSSAVKAGKASRIEVIDDIGQDLTKGVKSTGELKNLQSKLESIINSFTPEQRGDAAYKRAIRIKDAVKEQVKKSLPEELVPAYDVANQLSRKTRTIAELLPSDILAKGQGDGQKIKAIEKVAEFLRKAEIDGMSGDQLRARLDKVLNRVRELDPNFERYLRSKTEDIARRYELNQSAGKRFGTDLLGTAEAAAVRVADFFGGLSKSMRESNTGKAINSIKNNTDLVYQALKEKGSPYTRQLEKVVDETTPSQTKAAVIYGLYQQPAFRREVEEIVEEKTRDRE